MISLMALEKQDSKLESPIKAIYYFTSVLMFKAVHGITPHYITNMSLFTFEVNECDLRSGDVTTLYTNHSLRLICISHLWRSDPTSGLISGCINYVIQMLYLYQGMCYICNTLFR